jgi:hypothetical protein
VHNINKTREKEGKTALYEILAKDFMRHTMWQPCLLFIKENDLGSMLIVLVDRDIYQLGEWLVN